MSSNYRDFERSPQKQLTHETSGISPSISHFMSRDASSLPYWSPATQRADNESLNGFPKSPPSSLVPSAAAFVPKALYKEFKPSAKIDSAANSVVSMNGLNSTASEWVPPDKQDIIEENDQASEEMVEVTWNGSSFFVPRSQAIEYESEEVYSSVPAEEEVVGLDWSLGSTTLPAPPKRSLQTIGIPEPIRQHFQDLDLEALRQMAPDDERYKEIPPRYHSAFLLDSEQVHRGTGGSFGYPSVVYKVVDRADSQVYALRRFDNVRSSTAVVKGSLARWLEIRHPAIVSLYSIAQERGALFFAHAYHPLAETLKQRFIDPQSERDALITEELLLRFLLQLLAGLRLVHTRGMALRLVHPAHVLITSGTVARFNSPGVADVLEFESRRSLAESQADDIVKLGHLALSLASRTVVGPKQAEVAMQRLQQAFSTDVCRVVSAMLSGKVGVTQLCQLLNEQRQDEYDSSLAAADALHSHLRNEYENGRLMRLFTKLGFVNERPEYALAPQWGETGDRYILQLFRDYVFHQTLSDGAPVLDAGHVLTAMNKLDAGDPERIVLSSRDSNDLLVVSFADVRRCLENSFAELNQLSEGAMRATGAGLTAAAAGGGGGVGDARHGGRSAHGHSAQAAGYYKAAVVNGGRGGGGIGTSRATLSASTTTTGAGAYKYASAVPNYHAAVTDQTTQSSHGHGSGSGGVVHYPLPPRQQQQQQGYSMLSTQSQNYGSHMQHQPPQPQQGFRQQQQYPQSQSYY